MGVSQSKLSSTAIVATLVGAELISSVPGCSAGTVVYSGLMRPTAYSHISGISSSRGAVTGKVAGGGYTECRKAGYKHYECNKQGKGYVGCRKAGYKHNECNGQFNGSESEADIDEFDMLDDDSEQVYVGPNKFPRRLSGYTECRKGGYKHYECNKQGKGYVGCRKAGYKHNECNKQGKGYLNCRKRGYKHYECKGQYEDTSDEDMDLYEDYED